VKLTMAEVQGMLVLAQRNLEAGKRTAGGGEVVVAASMRALDAPTLNSSTAATRIAEFRAKYPATPPSGMDIDAARAWLRDRRAAFDALVQELTPSADGLTLPVKSGGTWMVSREARPDGSEWRITRFDKNMEPQGHEAHNSAANAVADMVSWADVARLKDWQPEFSRTPQTDTQAFKSWFGDSVVTDTGKPGGKPLVVYHGTAADFNEFSQDAYGTNFTGDYGVGFYFTQDPNKASQYAQGATGAAPNVMPVYLSLQNPAIVKASFADGDLWSMVPGAKTREDLTQGLKALGYDGVIVNGGRGGALYVKEAVAFLPEQVKSATGNRGSYDPNDPNIMFSRGAVEEAPEQPPRPNMLARAVGYQSLDDAGSPSSHPGGCSTT
jgi:hypothetical protein